MDQAKCELCGEPMPPGEQMFKFHGYSGPCPKPPLPRTVMTPQAVEDQARRVYQAWKNWKDFPAATGQQHQLEGEMESLGRLLNANVN